MLPETGDRWGSLSVLVVEDEPRLRELLLSAIPGMGFEAAGVGSAEAAREAMRDNRYAIIILDLNLPGVQGIEFFTEIHKADPEVQVIILTGYGDLDAARQAIHLDAVDFLTKPAMLSEIEQSLAKAQARLRKVSFAAGEPPEPVAAPPSRPTGRTLEEIEREHILSVLERHQGNRAAAASELGISLRTLYYRLSRYQQEGLLLLLLTIGLC